MWLIISTSVRIYKIFIRVKEETIRSLTQVGFYTGYVQLKHIVRVGMGLLRLTDKLRNTERNRRVKANCLLYSFAESRLQSIIGLSDLKTPRETGSCGSCWFQLFLSSNITSTGISNRFWDIQRSSLPQAIPKVALLSTVQMCQA